MPASVIFSFSAFAIRPTYSRIASGFKGRNRNTAVRDWIGSMRREE